MAELAAASGIVAFISLSIQLFDGCIKGFTLLSAVREYGSRAEIFRCQLEWQHYHFHSWATLVGLFKDPPELNVPNLPLVTRTLQSLEQLLNDVDLLQNEYGLKVDVTSEEIQEVRNIKTLVSGSKSPAARNFENDTAKVYRRRTSPWKKLKWAAVDHRKVETFLRHIEFFNAQLRGTLHYTEQTHYAGVSCDTLRSLISHTTDKAVLSLITDKLEVLDTAIQASARLKKKSLLVEAQEDDPPDRLPLPPAGASLQPTPYPSSSSLAVSRPSSPRRLSPAKALRLDFSLLVRQDTGSKHSGFRENAVYAGEPAVLEWKSVPQALERRLRHRIASVADLLSDMDNPAFHCLRCIGYIKEPKSSRYAYVFRPPFPEFSMRSLESILAATGIRPSLNQRLNLALALSETILQLHTARWLHKSINSGNILFYQPAQADWALLPDHSHVYLCGYEYARGDNVLETTEAPSMGEYSRLYRHPLSLTLSEDRIPFCKAFDLYSLGCVLLEIGLWRSLLALAGTWIQQKSNTSGPPHEYHLPAPGTVLIPKTASEWQTIYNEKETLIKSASDGVLADELRFCMGDAYTGLVRKCLTAASNHVNGKNDATDDDNEDDTDVSLELQLECVKKLKDMIERWS
ncbi:hypothetical protein ABEF95_003635 [Exophiala dermatitidis]